jgi:hypothetical protein
LSVLTKRTHSAPCFWLALWNDAYLQQVAAGGPPRATRGEEIFSLNVRGDKVLKTVVNNVFVDKNIGIAEITAADMKAFCAKHFPDELDRISAYVEKHPETLILDFENQWTGLEQTPAYSTAMLVGATGELRSREDLGNLACFVVLQNIRSHGMIRSLLEATEAVGIPRFEYYWMLKHMLQDVHALLRLVTPIAIGEWTLYRTSENSFPLPDSPVLVRDGLIMTALSPRMLAMIDVTSMHPEGQWEIIDGVPDHRRAEYRRRCIGNAFKEIIYSECTLLEEWQRTPEFRRRVHLMRDQRSYNEVVLREAGREVWKINAYGNIE